MIRRIATATAILLLCCACKPQRDESQRTTQDLSSTDPAFIAEDPALRKLIGQPGPSLILKTVDGGAIDVAQIYRTKPVYLKLWATYCIPCRFQMPGLERLYTAYGDKVQFVAVNAGVGDDEAKVRAFAKEYGITMPLAVDDGSLGAWLKMRATPVHLVMGRDGRIVFAGHQDGPKLEAAIRQAMDARDPGIAVESAKVAVLPAVGPGHAAPALDLLDDQGHPYHHPGGGTGRPGAILFTAVWCESYLKQTEPQSVEDCERVRRQADRLAETQNVDWLGIVTNLWTTPADLVRYERLTRPKIHMVLDQDGSAFRLFGIHRLPAVALISGEGRLVRVVGPGDDLAGAMALLTKPRSNSRPN